LRAAFCTHVPKLTRGLRAKLDTLMEALNEQFGTRPNSGIPKGGISPVGETARQCRHPEALPGRSAAGVAINPGPEWSTD
jgi:2-aminoadipate transaminase